METVKNEPLFDEDLQSILGSRYSEHRPAQVKKEEPAKAPEKKHVDPLAPAKWAPPKPDPNWLDRLKTSVKWTALYGGLCGLVFYWQQTELMDPAAAMPTMLACALLTGVSIGRAAIK